MLRAYFPSASTFMKFYHSSCVEHPCSSVPSSTSHSSPVGGENVTFFFSSILMAVGNRSIKMLDLIHQNFSLFVFCRRKSYKFGM